MITTRDSSDKLATYTYDPVGNRLSQTNSQNFDKTGKPPAGIAQGGRAGYPRGLFLNDKNKLPTKTEGYYKEVDIWPEAAGGRQAAERMIFGKEGEVYYSPDHYETFIKIR